MISSVVFLGTLNSSVRICKYTASGQFPAGQAGCYNLVPVFEWITHCIISIFLSCCCSFKVFFYLTWHSRQPLTFISHRTCRTWDVEGHSPLGQAVLLSLSPVFEIFSTQIYTHSILSNLTFGGARYIATGHGFVTTRIYFNILFSRFAGPTLIMLLYVALTLWTSYFIYFWISFLSLCIALFWSNLFGFYY